MDKNIILIGMPSSGKSTLGRRLAGRLGYTFLDTDEEIKQVDRQIRKTTVEKFGPVRRVRPTMVFELGFEGIQASTRHKSGIAVRFPRMLRWRTDQKRSAPRGAWQRPRTPSRAASRRGVRR